MALAALSPFNPTERFDRGPVHGCGGNVARRSGAIKLRWQTGLGNPERVSFESFLYDFAVDANNKAVLAGAFNTFNGACHVSGFPKAHLDGTVDPTFDAGKNLIPSVGVDASRASPSIRWNYSRWEFSALVAPTTLSGGRGRHGGSKLSTKSYK